MREESSRPRSRTFYKMTGSGNDFIFFDARSGGARVDESSSAIRALCARGTGVGADGVVLLERSERADIGIRYYNSDGSLASLCGNATLCAASLGVRLGAVPADGFTIQTDAGVLAARIRGGRPEVDFAPVAGVASMITEPAAQAGESAMGFALAGVPHLVVRVADVSEVDVERRGRELRFAAALGPEGANVNFVSVDGRGPGWRMRTYERGVEGETLACGTGCVAAAVLLAAWGEAGSEVALLTMSGESLEVSLRRVEGDGAWLPSLRGEGRLVFSGELAAL